MYHSRLRLTARDAALIAVTFALTQSAQAQSYPARPIRTVMTIGAGGGGDAVARLIGQKVHEALGQPMLIEPQGGAAGAVGAQIVARAAPDGYTVLYAISSTMIIRQFLTKNTSYDTVRDFTPLMMLGETVACVVASPAFPVSTLGEAIEYARRNPGKVSYGSSGIGTTHHLAGEMIHQITGAQMVHVPYKAGAQGGADALSGQIQLMFNILGSLQPMIGPGKLKLLAVNNDKRFFRLPEVPTIAELVPGYERPPSWTAYFGPAGLPQPIVKRLSDELIRAASLPEVKGKAEDLGFLVDPTGPVEFAAYIRRNLEVTAKIMKAAGIQPE